MERFFLFCAVIMFNVFLASKKRKLLIDKNDKDFGNKSFGHISKQKVLGRTYNPSTYDVPQICPSTFKPTHTVREVITAQGRHQVCHRKNLEGCAVGECVSAGGSLSRRTFCRLWGEGVSK